MLKAVKFLLQHANAGLLLSPGGRKTSCTLSALKILFEKEMIRKVLIIAPKRPCYAVWPAEIEKWAEFSHLTFEILHGPKKDEALARDAQIYLINPDGLDWLLKSVRTKYIATGRNKFTGVATPVSRTKVDVDVKAFKSFGFDTLVLDELHLFKHTNTQRFKALKQVMHTFSRRWGLTGSPAANGLLDLFGQCYILDQGHALGPYITHYRSSYFTSDVKGLVYKLMPGAEERIYEKISPLMLRLDTDAFQDLPELIENNIYVDLPDKARKIYDELEEDLLSMIDDRLLVAANAAAASIKCRQVASGGIYHSDPPIPGKAVGKRTWANVHDAKTEALRNLVDELQGSPILVAYDFEHDVDRLRKEFKDAVFACDVKDKDFRTMEKQWNNGEIPVLFGHPQSVGLGLNLQDAGYHVCWHSLTWDYGIYDQFNRRVYRSGNKSKSVYIHHIIARDTVDVLMMYAIRRKEKGQIALFNALMEYAKEKR